MSRRLAARILLAGLMAFSLAGFAYARPGHGGGHFAGSGHFRGGGHHFSGGHFHSRVFIGGTFFAPYYYPPYYYEPYYYSPPPVQYVEPAPAPQQYWYYCPSARAYYPYVQDCPGGWQKVLPQP